MRDSERAQPVVISPSDEYAVIVLLVDDQVVIGETVRRMLATHPDVDFHYCADPEAAIDLVRQIKPTVILQHLVMPGVDGLTLVVRIQPEEPILSGLFRSHG
jgi:two-component system chemotaxis family response regulator WspR